MGRLNEFSAIEDKEVASGGSGAIIASWLRNYSAEVTTPDRKSLDSAASQMWPQAPVYIASLPKDSSDKQLAVAKRLNQLGLRPVPHIVARNFLSEEEFAEAVRKFTAQAGVDRALVLGGDRDDPRGPLHSSLQLIRSGVFEEYGIKRIAIACYPEGHPRISDTDLDRALMDKLEEADKRSLDVRLITQLCFDAEPIIELIQNLRARGVAADLRVGLAGPARLTTLLKYAAICGVGSSLRALSEKRNLASGLVKAETPAAIVSELAIAQSREPSLAITGLHFFTFASLSQTIGWAKSELRRQV